LFTFDEASGFTAADSSGQGNALTLRGGASFAGGKFGNALTLDGVSGWAGASSTTGLDLSHRLTFAAFIEPDSVAPPGFYDTITVKGDEAARRGFGLNLTNNGRLNFVKMTVADVESTVVVTPGAWRTSP
jgi:hypothetical protein